MLVLSRRKNDTIIIGDVIVTIVSVKSGTVKLGIEADRGIPVMRGELVEGDDASDE
jgi:carbon storage regulator